MGRTSYVDEEECELVTRQECSPVTSQECSNVVDRVPRQSSKQVSALVTRMSVSPWPRGCPELCPASSAARSGSSTATRTTAEQRRAVLPGRVASQRSFSNHFT